MDDSRIIDLYWQRSETAIDETAKKYARYCHSISFNILRSEEDAEECVNDTWYAAWDKMPPERPQSLGAFLGRIPRNLSVSRWRQSRAQKRYSGMEVLLSELEECVPAPGTVEEDLERRQLAQAISTWLDTLGPEDRRLFIRRYWYGGGVKELAEEAGERANTLSQRLSRLRKNLRIFLESEGVEL